jgi:hypothetical protein
MLRDVQHVVDSCMFISFVFHVITLSINGSKAADNFHI